ncbi:MAG: DUF309 domain-containing protein [Ardenticatenales bacterium]
MEATESSPLSAAAHARRAAVARGRALFNRADFWASHEAWEAAWLAADGAERDGLQGLIQAAAAMHKFIVQDNAPGAVRLIDRALVGLERVGARGFGLDIASLSGELRQWRVRLVDGPPRGASIIGLPHLALAPAEVGARPLRVEAVDVRLIEDHGRRAVLATVRADGIEGWGESMLPWNEHGTWDAICFGLGPALLAEPVVSPAELSIVWRDVVAEPRAAAALEMAVWDLAARRDRVPLHVALGATARPVDVAMRVHGVTAAALAEGIGAARAAGFAGVHLPARPNADRRLLPGLARELAGLWFAFDLDGAYRLADREVLAVLDGLGPAFLHRALPDRAIADRVRLARWLSRPLSAAGVSNAHELHNDHALGAAAVVLVDPTTVPLSEAVLVLEAAVALGVQAWVGAPSLTPIAAAAALSLAVLPGATLPCAPGDGFGRWGHIVGLDGHVVGLDAGGRWQPSTRPGIGIDPPLDWLAAHEVRHERLHV